MSMEDGSSQTMSAKNTICLLGILMLHDIIQILSRREIICCSFHFAAVASVLRSRSFTFTLYIKPFWAVQLHCSAVIAQPKEDV